MTNQEWIQTAKRNQLAGFFQSLQCLKCSLSKEKCSGSRDLDCFDSINNWLGAEWKGIPVNE
jgi:hypothetical protein